MEVWKPIPGAPYYEASSLGRVRSLDREVQFTHRNGNRYKRLHKGRLLRQFLVKGYLSVVGNMRVNRLIAMAFVPNPKGLPEVNHKDGNKINNTPENLEWVTRAENMRHAWVNDLIARAPKGSNSKLKYGDAEIIKSLVDAGFKQSAVARAFNLHPSTVSKICSGARW